MGGKELRARDKTEKSSSSGPASREITDAPGSTSVRVKERGEFYRRRGDEACVPACVCMERKRDAGGAGFCFVPRRRVQRSYTVCARDDAGVCRKRIYGCAPAFFLGI